MKNLNNAKLYRENSDLNIKSSNAANNQPNPNQPHQTPDKQQKNNPQRPMDDKKHIEATTKTPDTNQPNKKNQPQQQPQKDNNKKNPMLANNNPNPPNKPGQAPLEEPFKNPPKSPIQPTTAIYLKQDNHSYQDIMSDNCIAEFMEAHQNWQIYKPQSEIHRASM